MAGRIDLKYVYMVGRSTVRRGIVERVWKEEILWGVVWGGIGGEVHVFM